MTKNKNNETEKDNKPIVLTEWQKRNIEFLEKKKAKEEEEKKLKEKLLIEKRSELQSQKDEVDKDSDSDKDSDQTAQEEESPQEEKLLKVVKVKKEKTKRHKAFIKALPVLVVSVLVLTLSIFVLTPYSKSKVYSSKGNDHTSLAQLIDQSTIKESDYFFTLLFSKSRYEKAIESNNPWIKQVNIHYSLPNRFQFDVKEFQIIAYAQVKDGFQPILENGRRVTIVKKAELPKSYLIINLENEKDVQNLVRSLTKLPDALVKNIKSVSSTKSASTSDLLMIELHDGNSIRVPQSQIEEKLPYYQKIKKQLEGKSIVDMEVGIYSTTPEIEAQPVKKEEKKKEDQTEQESANPNAAATNTEEVVQNQASSAQTPAQSANPTEQPAPAGQTLGQGQHNQ
ncbi:cell division protein FtsQ/DivIB [Streptococcus catagoni]|uniref:cell division protein FtsQ/DivIB n=1 Tax=Streptococcus catagoni TaxID=2654874 RepID=UPI0014091038|nr:FtsQ-type POTRA domain-containing protein [Streptococcus catagoni]